MSKGAFSEENDVVLEAPRWRKSFSDLEEEEDVEDEDDVVFEEAVPFVLW